MDQSTEELREFNLHEYLDGIIQSLSPQLKHTNYKVQLTCPEDINIRSYPSILTQIITNLVMNSLVHGFDGVNQGKMLLSVDPIEDKMLTLHYWDDGIGIQPDHVEKIFEPFFTTKRGQGGVGLGLNIVYNLITRTLSGTIDVESQPGEGVHFIIKVPVPDKMDQTVFQMRIKSTLKFYNCKHGIKIEKTREIAGFFVLLVTFQFDQDFLSKIFFTIASFSRICERLLLPAISKTLALGYLFSKAFFSSLS